MLCSWTSCPNLSQIRFLLGFWAISAPKKQGTNGNEEAIWTDELILSRQYRHDPTVWRLHGVSWSTLFRQSCGCFRAWSSHPRAKWMKNGNDCTSIRRDVKVPSPPTTRTAATTNDEKNTNSHVSQEQKQKQQEQQKRSQHIPQHSDNSQTSVSPITWDRWILRFPMVAMYLSMWFALAWFSGSLPRSAARSSAWPSLHQGFPGGTGVTVARHVSWTGRPWKVTLGIRTNQFVGDDSVDYNVINMN